MARLLEPLLSRKGRKLRAQRATLPTPHPLAWGALAFGLLSLLLVGVALRLGLLGPPLLREGVTDGGASPQLRVTIERDEGDVRVTVGDPSTETTPRGGLESLVAWLDAEQDGGPGPTTAEITILAILTAFAGARWRLAVLARRPGPVEVAFAPQIGAQAGRAETHTGDPTALVSYYADRFRTHLSASHLYPQTAIPDSSGGEAVIQLIESSSDTGNARLAANLLRLSTLIRPTHAYRVVARLHHRQTSPSFGISLQVEALGGRGASQVRECWAPDWEGAVRQAAHTAAAAILPVTRRLRAGALRSWEGLEMSPELFGRHQLAKAHLQDRRYEEAMGLYAELVRREDPTNAELRFEAGQVHEKLEQRIDALNTYMSVITLHPTHTPNPRTEPGTASKREEHQSGRRPIEPVRPTSLGPTRLLREARHELLSSLRFLYLARRHDPFLPWYRYIMQLGFTSVAEQLTRFHSGDPQGRDAGREQIRQQLMTAFAERYGDEQHRCRDEEQQKEKLGTVLARLNAPEGALRRAQERDEKGVLDQEAKAALAQREQRFEQMLTHALLCFANQELMWLSKRFTRLARLLSGTPLTAKSVKIARLWIEERQSCPSRYRAPLSMEESAPPGRHVEPRGGGSRVKDDKNSAGKERYLEKRMPNTTLSWAR